MEEIREASVGPGVRSESESRGLLASESATRLVYLTFGAAVIGAIFYKLQFSTASICCGDFDGYYHIKWSQLLWQGMRSGHFPPAFTWLPLTTLNPKDYVDHHLLFHILQIPFTWFSDLRMGAKVAALLFGTLAVLSCYWLVLRYRLSYPLLWLLALLACSAPFLYRLNMAKAPSVSIIFMVAGIYLLFERKYLWLGPLAFLYVWTYSLFVTLVAAAVIWTFVIAWSERRFEWRPALWTGVGTLAGFVINPYFPKNVRLFVEHLWIKVRVGEFSTSVGSEWYPYESWYLLGSCFVAFCAMVAGYIAFDRRDRERAARPLFFLIFSTLLMIATFRSRRFVEYWPPFAVLFAAFSLQTIFDGVRNAFASLPTEVMNDLQPLLDRHARADSIKRNQQDWSWRTILAGAIALALCVILFLNVRATAKEIANDNNPDKYRGGMEWIRTNVPAGETVLIFNTDWDDFPKMFYYDTSHSYISGLDPTYLLDQNPQLSKLYEEVTLGKVEDPGPIIRDRFGARYVFSDNEEVHDNFYFNAMKSGWFEKVYEDDECTVLHILDQKGEPQEVEENEENSDEQQNGSDDEQDSNDVDQQDEEGAEP